MGSRSLTRFRLFPKRIARRPICRTDRFEKRFRDATRNLWLPLSERLGLGPGRRSGPALRRIPRRVHLFPKRRHPRKPHLQRRGPGPKCQWTTPSDGSSNDRPGGLRLGPRSIPRLDRRRRRRTRCLDQKHRQTFSRSNADFRGTKVLSAARRYAQVRGACHSRGRRLG